MDYKKIHKDTLAKLQEMVNSGKITAETARSICADFVPESEDERIRRALIKYLDALDDNEIRYGVSFKDMRTWLEKQAKNNMGISEATKQELEYNLNKALEKETPESWNEFLDKQGEPSVKWNENTDSNKPQRNHSVLMKTTHGIAEGERRADGSWLQYKWSSMIKDSDVLFWIELSDLEKQGEQKPAWCEEDEKIITQIRDAVEDYFPTPVADKIKSWLKSLKDKYAWKPSDKQMQALSNAGNSFRPFEEGHKVLWSLYNDLKKLRGE